MKQYVRLLANLPDEPHADHPKWIRDIERALHDGYHALDLGHGHVDPDEVGWHADHTHLPDSRTEQ